MIEFERTRKQPKEPSLLPLINVIFLLLVFFLVAGNVDTFEIIPIEPPVAKSGKLLEEGKIVVILGRHDELIINDDLVEIDQFIPALTAVIKDNPEKVITLKTDATIPATNMIAVMDKIKAAGGKNVSLIVQKAATE